MGAITAPVALYEALFPGTVPDASSKIGGFKDLSVGGACQTGYGEQTKIHKTLKYISDLKHIEKNTPYLRWAVAFVPAFLDVFPKIVYHDKKRTPLCEMPGRAYTVIYDKISNISARQLGFLLSIVPLYNNTRALRNCIWTGDALDPSGHTSFKIAQYGMMYSIATDHGTKSSINIASVYYLVITAIADTVMLTNTMANCHTLTEIAVGGGLGAAVLLAAHLIGKYTPLGDVAQEIAIFSSHVGSAIKKNILGLPQQMTA